MKKRTMTIIGAGIVVAALAACGGQPGGATSDLSGSSSVSSAQEDYVDYVTLTLNGTNLDQGKTLASIGYKVIAHHTVEGDYNITGKSSCTLTITSPSGKTGFKDTDPLMESGTYTIVASYRNQVDSEPATFTVSSGDVDQEDHFKRLFDSFDGKDQWHLQENQGDHILKSTGTQRLLVVPVQFQDYKFTDDQLVKLQKAFFGEAEETSWESLASYYKKSSYGKLNLTGEIAPVFTAKETVAEAAALKAEDVLPPGEFDSLIPYWNISWYYADESTSWLREQGFDVDSYDNDPVDGYIDAVWMIYPNPQGKDEKGREDWWAWVHRDYVNRDLGEAGEPAIPYDIGWASYRFIEREYAFYNDDINIDCHTLVHETGHLMGLNDYYDTTSTVSPTGGVSMMDLNIGDHTPYSKMCLDWTTPRVIEADDENADYFISTLKPFTETGDCLLLHTNSQELSPTAKNPNNDEPNQIEAWNQTPFDEYILIAYYTPDGLFEKDAVDGYPEWANKEAYYGHGGPFDKPGIVAYHIDSRMLKVRPHGNSTWVEWTDDFYPSTAVFDENGALVDGSYIRCDASNTPGKSQVMTPDSETGLSDIQFYQETLLSSDGRDDFLKKAYGERMGVSESNLFLPDKNFGFSKEKFKNFFPYKEGKSSEVIFNDGTPIEYNFAVTEINYEKGAEGNYAKILFAKVA